MSRAPDQEWWTSAELAAAGLPDVPGTRQGINAFIRRNGYQGAKGKARRRAGRGGGWEYHWTLLPSRAQQSLLAHASAKEVPTSPPEIMRDEAWAAFEALSAKAKDKARARLAAIQTVEALVQGGTTKHLAVIDAARLHGFSARAIWGWFERLEGKRADDRLAYLADRRRAGRKAANRTQIDPRFGDLILGDYLRLSGPSLRSVHRRQVAVAKAAGIPHVPYHTVNNWIKRKVSPTAMVLARKGYDALKGMRPAQTRDKTALHAMEAINGDFHRFDVFVQFPAGPDGQPAEIGRPQMCAFQDIYSGKILSWRLDRTPNSHCVQLTMGDLIEEHGIPAHVLLDNGREFAAKLITGGTRTRFRFKVKEDDPSGLLTSLGCEVHWAKPYSGQSKPIERAFRDMCDDIAKHPAFEGAYTGNSPTAKPENYGSRAIPLAAFQAVVEECIKEHNARPDRRSEVANGRSFDDVFAESYATAPIRKATAAQRRLWLMGAEGVRACQKTGRIRFMRNTYWTDWMNDIMGEKVVVRFDRQALWDGLHIYSLDDEYLGHAPCQAKSGFFDMDDARATASAQRNYVKARRAELDALRKLNAADVAAAWQESLPDPAPEPVTAKVIAPIFDAPRAPVPAETPADVAAKQAEIIADLDARRVAKAPPLGGDEGRVNYARWLELSAEAEAGATLTKEQRRWLQSYPDTAEFRTWKGMVESFGMEALGNE